MLKRKKPTSDAAKSLRQPKGRRRAAKAGRGLKLGTFGVLIFIAAAAVVLAGGLVFSQITQLRLNTLQRHALQTAGVSYATQIQALVTGPMRTIEGMVTDPAVREVMSGGDAAARTAKAQELARLLPGVWRVRLLPPGVNQVDTSTAPPLGYADLQMLRMAEQRDAFPPVEVELPGTAQAHFSLMHRIVGNDQSLLGVLMATYSPQVVGRSVAQLELDGGAVELRQGGSVVLARRGAHAAGRSDAVTVRVPGSRWNLVYWAGREGGQMIAADWTAYAAIYGVVVVVLAIVIYLAFRALAGAMRRDQVTILNLVKDILNRRLAPNYPVRLAGSRVSVELLLGMGQEYAAAPSRGQPAAAKAESPVPDLTAAPTFLHGGGIEIEDEAAAEADLMTAGLDKVPASIFRAYDIRGVVGDTLTAEIVEAIGRAIGSEAFERGQQAIVIGRDGRLSGPELSEALARGLMASGRDVIDVGMVPTPVLYFATHYLRTGSGAMVTGSHNPADYNGLKMVLRDETLSGEAIQALRTRIQSGDLLNGQGAYSERAVVDDYVDRITGDVQVARRLKVVVDCGNGVAGAVAPVLLRGLGCEVVELFCEVDGTFPNHHPDPGKPENLRALIARVREVQADLGVAFDGDGDRLGVVDEQGKLIFPDRLLMLFAKDLLSRHPGASVIFDVKCSRNLKRVITENAGQPMMWKTGHSFIKAAMKKTGALLAGEMSGHFFFKERWFGFDDGLYAAARLLEILSAEAGPASRVFGTLPDSVSTPELNVQLREGEQHAFIEELVARADFPDAEVTTIDGVRADFADGFGLVRASNTTPVLVLRFEGDDEAALKRIQEAFRVQLLAVRPDLELPF